MPGLPSSTRGSVVLVALCFVAVLAIAVTTYLTLSSRAMNLSARTYNASLSSQLAEIGLELGMSSLNNSSWGGWTTTGVKATRTHTPSADLSMGVSGSVEIQITNRYASVWKRSATYSVGHLAWYRGQWYQCTAAVGPTTTPPADDTANWISVPGAWSATTFYAAGDVVTYDGTAYRCVYGHVSRTPPDSTYWATTGSSAWSSSTSYGANDTAMHGGTLYRCISASTNHTPPNTSYWAGAPVIYAEGIVTASANDAALRTQLRAEFAPGALFPNAVGATNSSNSIQLASSGTIASYNSNNLAFPLWSSGCSYIVGDTVYYTGTGLVYRCILNHSNQAPVVSGSLNATYWIPAVTAFAAWDGGNSYVVGDFVYYAGTVYRCISNHTNRVPPNGTYWASQSVGHGYWSNSTTYARGDVVLFQPPQIVAGRDLSAILYRSRANSNFNRAPATSSATNYTYWEPATVGVSNWTSVTGYKTGDIVFYDATGLFYRSVANSFNQAPASSTVTNTSFWVHAGRAFTPWSSATSYSVGAIVFNSSDAVVYRCVQAHSNQAPPNATYWARIGTDFADWSSSAAYQVGDIVYRNSNQTVYRCIKAHTNYAPPNATYWTTNVYGHSAVLAAPAVTSSSTAVVRGFINATSTSFGSNAVVQGPESPSSPKVDQSRVSSNPYVPAFEPPGSYAGLSGPGINLPDSEGNGTRLYQGTRTLGRADATSPTVYNITATYTSSSGTTSGMYISDTTDILTIIGPVILNVSGILYTNSGRIVVAPTGSLEIYFNGSQLYIGNSTANTGGGIFNQTFNPAKMLIVSANTTNSSSYHYYWSREPFHGLIYMPYAYLHKWNSGYNGEIYGAVSARTVYFNHAANVDYDLALRTAGSIGTYIEQPFQITSWRELTDPAEQVSL